MFAEVQVLLSLGMVASMAPLRVHIHMLSTHARLMHNVCPPTCCDVCRGVGVPLSPEMVASAVLLRVQAYQASPQFLDVFTARKSANHFCNSYLLGSAANASTQTHMSHVVFWT